MYIYDFILECTGFKIFIEVLHNILIFSNGQIHVLLHLCLIVCHIRSVTRVILHLFRMVALLYSVFFLNVL